MPLRLRLTPNVISFALDRAARPDSSFSPMTYWNVSQGAMSSWAPYLLETCSAGSGLCSPGLGSFADRAHPTNRVVFSGFLTPRIFAFLELAGARPATGPPISQFAIYRAVVQLVDESPPTIDAASGSLIRPGTPLAGEAAATVVARDAGGGISTIGLLSMTRSSSSGRSTP